MGLLLGEQSAEDGCSAEFPSLSWLARRRSAPFLHRQLVLEAEENHVSLNRLISTKRASG
jgi:hypothetical protein